MIPKGVGPDLPDSLLRAHRSRGAPCVTGDHGQSNVILPFVKNFLAIILVYPKQS